MIYNFNLVMHSNVCEYLWGRLQFVRLFKVSVMKAITFLIPVSMLIAGSNYQNNMSN